MTERLVATSRNTLAEGLLVCPWQEPGDIADYLIRESVVRVVDPTDPELVDVMATAIRNVYVHGKDPLPDWYHAAARAAIRGMLI